MLAAAVSTSWRAAAPISRRGCKKWRRLREPSVFCPPYVASSPRAWAILTRDQSASSSSATAIGSAVRTPWPISDRCATMVTSPVSSMDTNAVGLKRGTSTAGAAGARLATPRDRRPNPTTKPPKSAAPPMKKLRRLMFSSIAAISRPPCRGLDRRANPLVGAAAADVAGHGLVDIVIGGLRRLGEQAGGLHDLPALAVAALRDVQAAPRRLDAPAHRRRADSLDRRDLLAFRSRDRRDARARRRTVQVHRARAAEGHATPELGAGESQFVAQRPEQWRVRGHIDRHCVAIDVESGHTGFAPSNRSLASDQRVHRPYPGTAEDQRDRQAESEDVVFHALALLDAKPVHEESVLPVDGDRDNHDNADAKCRHTGQEADGQAERPEELGHDRQEREGAGNARLHQETHGALAAVATEPADRLLGTVGEHHHGQRQPQHERNDAAVGLKEPSKHQDFSRAGGAMNSGPTGSVIAFAWMRSMAARASASRLQPNRSSIGES